LETDKQSSFPGRAWEQRVSGSGQTFFVAAATKNVGRSDDLQARKVCFVWFSAFRKQVQARDILAVKHLYAADCIKPENRSWVIWG
jgi:ketosteroid isomerase-like protein